jgi:hypothetical protein
VSQTKKFYIATLKSEFLDEGKSTQRYLGKRFFHKLVWDAQGQYQAQA